MIATESGRLGITGIEYEGCYFIKFKMTKGSDADLVNLLLKRAEQEISSEELVAKGEIPVFGKYDEMIPTDLLRKAYAVDHLDPTEASGRILDISNEF